MSFESYCPQNAVDRHTHRADCFTWTTKWSAVSTTLIHDVMIQVVLARTGFSWWETWGPDARIVEFLRTPVRP